MTSYITPELIHNFEDIILDVGPGDELIFDNSVYYLDKQITIKCYGTPEKPIVIGGVDFQHRPIFDFRHQPYGNQENPDCNGFRIIGDNIIIQNLIIRYSGFKGLKLEAKNTTVKNIETYGCCDSGIQIVSGGNNTIINCDSHDNFGYKPSMSRDGLNMRPFGFNSDGISDKLHGGEPDIFIGCRSWNNTDDGFDFYERECEKGEIEMYNCWSFNNGKALFDMTGHPRYEVDKEWFDTFISGQNVTYKDIKTRATLTEYPAFGNGHGFKLGGNYKKNNIRLSSCISIENNGKGYHQNNNLGEITLSNCYAGNNKKNDYWFSNNSGIVTIENCESKGGFKFECRTKIIGNNLFNEGSTKYIVDMLMWPRDKDGNPPTLIKT